MTTKQKCDGIWKLYLAMQTVESYFLFHIICDTMWHKHEQ